MSDAVQAAAGGRIGGAAWLRGLAPNLAFALRLTASVCLALYVSFWLQVDNPGWAGTSAAITCQPVLGAALRKGQFRFLGTLVGAVFLVVLTALVPQQRIFFLGGLVAWGGLCSFLSTLIKGPASYAVMLAGYTTAIIASTSIAEPDNAFWLALNRASEITIGIACATVVLTSTDLGGARATLAAALRPVVRDVRADLLRTLAAAGVGFAEAQTARRALIKRIAALDPLMDNAIAESGALRYRRPALQAAIQGLFTAISGWRVIAVHLQHLSPEAASQAVRPPLEVWPQPTADAPRDREQLNAAARHLVATAGATPSQRLIADQAAAALRGLARAANALALLADPASVRRPRRVPSGRAPDWLPAVVNALRVMLAITLACILWIATAWPSGLLFITFVAIPALLLSPLNEAAARGALAFIFGCILSAIAAGLIEFAVLPQMHEFSGFCFAVGLALIPLGMLQASPRWGTAIVPATSNILPILSPTNVISYNTENFYNLALAITSGCVAAATILWLIPPLAPATRARRLASATLRDLRRLLRGHWHVAPDVWQGRILDRLAVLPDQAAPVIGARMLTAALIGTQFLRLQVIARRFGATELLAQAAAPFAAGDLAAADHAFRALEARLAAVPPDRPGASARLRARAAILEIIEAMEAHGEYLGAPA